MYGGEKKGLTRARYCAVLVRVAEVHFLNAYIPQFRGHVTDLFLLLSELMHYVLVAVSVVVVDFAHVIGKDGNAAAAATTTLFEERRCFV